MHKQPVATWHKDVTLQKNSCCLFKATIQMFFHDERVIEEANCRSHSPMTPLCHLHFHFICRERGHCSLPPLNLFSLDSQGLEWLSLSFTHTHTNTHTNSHFLLLTLSHTPFISLSLSLKYTHTFSFSHIHFLSL